MPRPKLLIATKAFWPVIGGVEEVVREVATGCSQDFDVTVLAVNDQRITVTERCDGFAVTKVRKLAKVFSAPLSLEYLPAFRRLAAGADIINMHSPYPLSELALRVIRPHSRVVISYHFDIVRQKIVAPLYNPLLSFTLGYSDRIVVSNPNVRRFSGMLAPHADKIVEIPYGINLDQYRLSPALLSRTRDLRAGHPRPLVLFVGRLVYYKGVEYLIRAAAEVDVDLVIIGEGPFGPRLKKLVDQLGLGARVHFLPHLPKDELLLFFHACDCFVLPSVARSEAFGIVLIEAMACGKPLVSTELGTGTSWVNQHNTTGFVVPAGDPQALAEAIRRIVSDRELADDFGKAAERRAREVFSREAFASRYVRLFRELLDSRP
jgi:glycosyltransferase involved in cell wall biosynthesis